MAIRTRTDAPTAGVEQRRGGDTAPREVMLPPDLAAALAGEPHALRCDQQRTHARSGSTRS